MEKEILDELNKIADGFWYDKKILDQGKIQINNHLRKTNFGSKFDVALNDFLKIRRINIKNRDYMIDKLLGGTPTGDFLSAYNKFLEVVATAKSHDLLIDKEIVKELEKCKEERTKLENNREADRTTIEKQKQIIDNYRSKIKSVVELHPKLASVFGIQESEVEEI